ncbi:MAG: DUF3459 domain-containing protein, partial [Actinobacteria bacterium]|nr:DUF3459 domain-containing protein [Actinomycetota bacterium]
SDLDAYPGERAMVGEVNLASAGLLAPYYGQGDELHMVFNFSLLRAKWDPDRWAELIADSEAALAPSEAWPVWVLSNHDTPRHRTRYGGSGQRARVAATVLLTLRGTPFLYAGEELGLEDAEIPAGRRVDPGGRDGCRAPIPWTGESDHGWSGPPWLPWPPTPRIRNVDALRSDNDSILHLYRRLVAARAGSPALQLGEWRLLDAPPGVLAYERRHEGDTRRVAANFDEQNLTVLEHEGWTVDVATDRAREQAPWDGQLGATEAVVLRPA